MADISAKDVMKLRNRTGLSMMACKKALVETEGDLEAAENHLRKQLKGKMEKRADRVAGEGRVAVAVAGDGKSAAIVELKAETDFTARNQKFIDLAQQLADKACAAEGSGNVELGDEMTQAVEAIKAETGENISVGRIAKVEAEGDTKFGTYVHHDGKTGVLIVAQGDVGEETLKQVGMHVTAAVPRPLGVSADDIPEELVKKERKFRVEQAMESGKPEEIAEKMVEGGMKKFFAEVALLEQKFVMDENKTIREVIAPGTITAFHRWQVGESGDEDA